MLQIIKIAWRNVWRNKLRSFVVILSIVLGIWAGLFIMSLTLGLNEQRMNGAINTYLSHIQIHNPKYLNDPDIHSFILHRDETLSALQQNENVKAFSTRANVISMVSSSKGAFGVRIVGIDPEQEKKVSNIYTMMKSGEYFTKFKRNPAVIGQKLADKLGVKVRSKIILSFQDMDKEIISAAFRVEGIYKTSSSRYDEFNIFVKRQDIDRLAKLQGNIHEIAVICPSINQVAQTTAILQQAIPDSQVRSWSDVAPELGYAQKMMSSAIYIFMGIILFALAFGIINTMLMAILERRRELGMLMSVGMNKVKLFLMIVFETIFLSTIAVPVGMLLSYLFIQYFAHKGIDLSVAAKGLESLGIGAIIYPYLPTHFYFTITLMTVLVAFISSLIPAKKALSLNPAEAVRSI